MARHYDELVQVHQGWVDGEAGGEGAPAQVLWRERLYLVREVLAHWVETTPWWQSAAVRALHGGGTSPTPAAALSPGWDSPVPDAGAGAPVGSPVEDTGDREVWRVEARAGRIAPRVVLDLALDSATGSWRVLRCHD